MAIYGMVMSSEITGATAHSLRVHHYIPDAEMFELEKERAQLARIIARYTRRLANIEKRFLILRERKQLCQLP